MKKQVQAMIVGLSLNPWIAIAAGVLILLRPKFLNYIVAVYLIVTGLLTLLH